MRTNWLTFKCASMHVASSGGIVSPVQLAWRCTFKIVDWISIYFSFQSFLMRNDCIHIREVLLYIMWSWPNCVLGNEITSQKFSIKIKKCCSRLRLNLNDDSWWAEELKIRCFEVRMSSKAKTLRIKIYTFIKSIPSSPSEKILDQRD